MDIESAYRSRIIDIIDRIRSDLSLLPDGPENESLRLVLEELEAAVIAECTGNPAKRN